MRAARISLVVSILVVLNVIRIVVQYDLLSGGAASSAHARSTLGFAIVLLAVCMGCLWTFRAEHK